MRGLRSGHGSYVDDLIRYEGQWIGGLRQGRGNEIRYDSRGEIVLYYSGSWREGDKHGKGIESYGPPTTGKAPAGLVMVSTGGFYEGQFEVLDSNILSILI